MELAKINKSYGGVAAVKNFSISIGDDEYLTLLGPSGCGKSTLLRLVAGLETPDSGSILLDGQDITSLPTHQRGLGFVQQKFGLFPHMSVFDNVAFGLRFRELEPISDEGVVGKKVDNMLDIVGLADLGARKVGALSGGQRQRVSLARTLVCGPKICLLDEPLGALDANLRKRMTVELRRIRSALGVSFVHVTGNEVEALAMGDRMIVMDKGEAVQVDNPDTIYHHPQTVQIAKLLSRYNILSGKQSGKSFSALGAEIPVPNNFSGAAYCAVRYDSLSIRSAKNENAPSSSDIKATFVASEFLGARIIYFFRAEDGTLLEAERHLSAFTPDEFLEGDTCYLNLPVESVLFYDQQGNRIGQVIDLEAA